MKTTEIIGDIKTSIISHDDGSVTFNTEQDVEGYLDDNERLRNSGTTKTKHGWYVASVPMVVYEEWLKEAKDKGIPDINSEEGKAFITRKLNDKDFSKLRTTEGDI